MKGRLEDHRMLTGQGRYVSDWNLPGQAHGVFLRSDRAHAKILGIEKEEALKRPGVLAVFTGKELVDAGLKPLPAAAPFKWKDGSDQRLAQRLSLAHQVVRHVGEAVALIVAAPRSSTWARRATWCSTSSAATRRRPTPRSQARQRW
jgi:carbon-monoxide dehydrogenase large subunit